MRKAYLCSIVTWKGLYMVYPAETRGKAKAQAWFNGYSAGYDIRYTDVRAKRVPEFDDLARETEGKIPWCLGWRDGNATWGCLKE